MAIIHGVWTTILYIYSHVSLSSSVGSIGRSVRRSVGRSIGRCNPDRKIPVMNGKRRPRPQRLYSTVYIMYIVLYTHLHVIRVFIYIYMSWEGKRQEERHVCGEEKKRFAPLWIRRDGRFPGHRRLITRCVYVCVCVYGSVRVRVRTPCSETRLINHSSLRARQTTDDGHGGSLGRYVHTRGPRNRILCRHNIYWIGPYTGHEHYIIIRDWYDLCGTTYCNNTIML